MPALSNEAEELHRMCGAFQGHISNNSTAEALADLFGVTVESAEYFAFVSAVRLRFQRFLSVVDQSVSNDRKDDRAV
ncbi:hypothetical protein FHT76_007829 [Rhizobium sp. BK176]|nr:hypothetical protein [Rhizobium sp. BK176]